MSWNVDGADPRPQFRREFDWARDPYAARSAIGLGKFAIVGPLINAVNDAAAAAAGVPVNALYRNGSVVQIRVT